MMAFETVTEHCWPESVVAGRRIAIHLSSAGGGGSPNEITHAKRMTRNMLDDRLA